MAWNVEKLVFSRSKTLDGAVAAMVGMAFGSSGTKLYSVNMSDERVREYNLSQVYNPFSETYVQELDISGVAPTASDVSFNTTGSVMYVNEIVSGDIHSYNLSTPWNISTGVYSTTKSTGYAMSDGFRFKPDGSMLYITGGTADVLVGYSLSTPWDISTMLKTHEINVSATCSGLNKSGIDFKPDGSKMYISCGAANTVIEYGLRREWDISTAEYIRASGCTVAIDNLLFNAAGNIVYSGALYEYILPTGKARPSKSA